MDIPEAPAVQGPDAERPVVVDYTDDWPAVPVFGFALRLNRAPTETRQAHHNGAAGCSSIGSAYLVGVASEGIQLADPVGGDPNGQQPVGDALAGHGTMQS